MKILHVLQMSLPDFSGYAYRSKYIVETQKKIGFEPYVISSYFQRPVKKNSKIEEINGIKYFRTFFTELLGVKKGKSRWISRIEYFLS